MNRRRLTVAGLVGLSLGLAACSPKESAAPAAPKRSPSVEIVAAEGRGLTVGAMMSTQAVYVLFDTQCPHCARLWEASVPLQKKAKFIWIPVGLLNAASSAQGAALLAAADPAQAMAAHEKSMLAGQGGISGVENAASLRKFVVDFKGGDMERMAPEAPLEVKAEASTGRITSTILSKVAANDAWRLVLDMDTEGQTLIELKASILANGTPATETWLYQWRG